MQAILTCSQTATGTISSTVQLPVAVSNTFSHSLHVIFIDADGVFSTIFAINQFNACNCRRYVFGFYVYGDVPFFAC